MRYATKEEVKAFMEITTLEKDDILDAMLSGVENFIDNHTQRSFVAGSAAEVRYFAVTDGGDEFDLDDMISIANLYFSEASDDVWTALAATDYWLMPHNKYPKTWLKLNPNGDWSEFPVGPRTVKVSGRWGYSVNVPQDIKDIAIALTSRMFRSKDAGMSEGVGMAVIGEYKIGQYMDAKLTSMLAPYRKFMAMGIPSRG